MWNITVRGVGKSPRVVPQTEHEKLRMRVVMRKRVRRRGPARALDSEVPHTNPTFYTLSKMNSAEVSEQRSLFEPRGSSHCTLLFLHGKKWPGHFRAKRAVSYAYYTSLGSLSINMGGLQPPQPPRFLRQWHNCSSITGMNYTRVHMWCDAHSLSSDSLIQDLTT